LPVPNRQGIHYSIADGTVWLDPNFSCDKALPRRFHFLMRIAGVGLAPILWEAAWAKRRNYHLNQPTAGVSTPVALSGDFFLGSVRIRRDSPARKNQEWPVFCDSKTQLVPRRRKLELPTSSRRSLTASALPARGNGLTPLFPRMKKRPASVSARVRLALLFACCRRLSCALR